MLVRHPSLELDHLLFDEDEEQVFYHLLGLFQRYLYEYQPSLYYHLFQCGLFGRMLKGGFLRMGKEDVSHLQDFVRYSYWAIEVYRPADTGKLLQFLWRMEDTMELRV